MRVMWKLGAAALLVAAGVGWLVGQAGSDTAKLPDVGDGVRVSSGTDDGPAEDASKSRPTEKGQRAPAGHTSLQPGGDDVGEQDDGAKRDDDVKNVTPDPDDVDDDDDHDDAGDDRDEAADDSGDGDGG